MAERHHGLDAARAVAMMLVIATHTALSFMVTPIGWAIQDRSRHVGVDVGVWIVRAFVMPMFFWLSGYFGRAVFEAAGVAGFVRHRITRILIPLALAIIPCSLALDALWDHGREIAGRATVAASVPKLQGSGLPITLGHLWYLYYLLVVSVFALAALAIARRFGRPSLAGWRVSAPIALVVIGVLGIAGVLQLDTPLSFAIDPGVLAFQGAFFAWGWLLHARKSELDSYASRAWWIAATAPVLLLVLGGALRDSADPATTGRAPLYAIVASGAFSLVTVAAFVGLCVRYATRRNRVLRLASEASYWSYIVHLPLVVSLQIVVANSDVPGTLKYVAIVVVTSIACLVTYLAFVRATPLRRILG